MKTELKKENSDTEMRAEAKELWNKSTYIQECEHYFPDRHSTYSLSIGEAYFKEWHALWKKYCANYADWDIDYRAADAITAVTGFIYCMEAYRPSQEEDFERCRAVERMESL